MIKIGKNFILFLTALLLTAGGGYWGWQRLHVPQAAATKEKPAAHTASDMLHFPADAPQLAFLKIKPADAFPEPLIDGLNARIAYDDNYTARIFTPIAGRVVKITAEAGQQVKAGDPLLWIDSPDYAAGASDSLKADADLLRKKEAYERSKKLFDAKGLAFKDIESAEADWRQADAEAQRAKARMKNLGGNAVATAEGKFILRAPIDGIVSERQVNAGSEVRPDAATPLFVITNPKHVWVVVELPEQWIGSVRVGQPISVEADAYPNEVFSGKVAVISETLDPVMRRFQVRCNVDNSQRKLKPEMFARISPIVDAKSKLPRVPNSALFTQGLYSFLFVERSPGVLQRRRVTLGMQDATFTYIKDGLRAGERVVTSGALLLNSELSVND
ncbi:MAG: efflux RND transporter periplasmic adaptor subunit [Gallionellaceae bacterium]|nr:efflux RND transporter periplasmic adaptor subunit [Gallionellaceae bacterium]